MSTGPRKSAKLQLTSVSSPAFKAALPFLRLPRPAAKFELKQELAKGFNRIAVKNGVNLLQGKPSATFKRTVS